MSVRMFHSTVYSYPPYQRYANRIDVSYCEDHPRQPCKYACEICFKLMCDICFDNRQHVYGCDRTDGGIDIHLVKTIDYVASIASVEWKRTLIDEYERTRNIILAHLNELNVKYPHEREENERLMEQLRSGKFSGNQWELQEATTALRRHIDSNDQKKALQVTQVKTLLKAYNDAILMYERPEPMEPISLIKHCMKLRAILRQLDMDYQKTIESLKKETYPVQWANSAYVLARNFDDLVI